MQMLYKGIKGATLLQNQIHCSSVSSVYLPSGGCLFGIGQKHAYSFPPFGGGGVFVFLERVGILELPGYSTEPFSFLHLPDGWHTQKLQAIGASMVL